MDLSLIIPVYNAEGFIGESLELLHAYVQRSMKVDFEILVVNDGSTDATSQVLAKLSLPRCRFITLPQNMGKFAAVRAGMLAATGRCRIFTDGDIPYDLEAIPFIYHQIHDRGLHMVVGDRSLLHSTYCEKFSPIRAAISKVFTLFVRLLVVSGLHDTQCGLKGVRGDVATPLFSMLQDRGFSGDVEMLYIALKYNLEIKRIPVRLRRHGKSSVNVLRHGIQMLARISRLRGSWKRGEYDSEELRRLVDMRYWNTIPQTSLTVESVSAKKVETSGVVVEELPDITVVS
jgi:dolichyl-phosphate beta-glucosyltransferase